MRSIVLCKLPKAGLGNQLFPLLKAMVFSKLNNLPIKVIGYHQLKLGPYLRNEKIKRNYSKYFKFQKSLLGESIDILSFLFIKAKSIKDCSLFFKPDLNVETIYIFTEISGWNDYFFELKDIRVLVIKTFYSIVSENLIQKLNTKTAPIIGIHVRMGDFKKLRNNEEFKNKGTTRTPEDYFIKIVNEIRLIKGVDVAVTIFTDGYEEEFIEIPKLSNVSFEKGNVDIIDLMLLSKSKIIITSLTSTFSYWAGFLSDAAIIMHPDYNFKPLRSKETNSLFYEGPMNINGEINPLLIANIQNI